MATSHDTKYVRRFFNIFVAKRIFVLKKYPLELTLINNNVDINCLKKNKQNETISWFNSNGKET